jgi:hypothetical protein
MTHREEDVLWMPAFLLWMPAFQLWMPAMKSSIAGLSPRHRGEIHQENERPLSQCYLELETGEKKK